MGLQWDKQPASRVIKTQTLSYTGAGTVVSSNFGPQTYQLRVTTQVTGYGEIDNLGTVITTATRDSVGFDGATAYLGRHLHHCTENLSIGPGEIPGRDFAVGLVR